MPQEAKLDEVVVDGPAAGDSKDGVAKGSN